jgi:SRSO17 transposase
MSAHDSSTLIRRYNGPGIFSFNDKSHGLWTRGLLIRLHIADGDLAYFTTWCTADKSIATLVNVDGHRRVIEGR